MAKARKKSKVTLIVGVVVALGLIGAVIGLAVKLDRQTTVVRVGSEAYSIGAIDETGAYESSDASIYLRSAITVNGLKCELVKDAEISYQIFFYDEDGKFISATDVLTTDFDGTGIPENATEAKIVITPTADEDGKVSLLEKSGYADQLKVTTDR